MDSFQLCRQCIAVVKGTAHGVSVQTVAFPRNMARLKMREIIKVVGIEGKSNYRYHIIIEITLLCQGTLNSLCLLF